MGNLQIYTWVGVPARTTCWFDRVESRWDALPGNANKLDIR
jgi:hypothetical protein